MLIAARVGALVDVRRFPGSRRHPHFGRDPLAATVRRAGIPYVHAEELGGRRSREPGEDRFACIRTPAFRSYAARMGSPAWQSALAETLALARPCFLCAETLWWRCHRRLIAELLAARGFDVVHLVRPHEARPHRPMEESAARDGRLYLCGELVA